MNDTTLNTVSGEAGSQRDPGSMALKGDSFIISPDDPILVTGAAAVSYTHLDVYKRQFRDRTVL